MDEQTVYKLLTVIAAVGGFVLALLILWACLNVSGLESREEEKRDVEN